MRSMPASRSCTGPGSAASACLKSRTPNSWKENQRLTAEARGPGGQVPDAGQARRAGVREGYNVPEKAAAEAGAEEGASAARCGRCPGRSTCLHHGERADRHPWASPAVRSAAASCPRWPSTNVMWRKCAVPSKVLTTCYHRPPAAGVPRAAGRWSRGRRTPAAGGGFAPRATGPQRAGDGGGDAGVLSPAAAADHAVVFAQLPGMKISPGAIVKQIQRLGRWLGKQYHRLKLVLQCRGWCMPMKPAGGPTGTTGNSGRSPATGYTLHHVDRSRAAGR